MEDLLPVGSVIETNDLKRLMIVGYFPTIINSIEMYDYLCCDSKKGLTDDIKNLKKNVDYFYIKASDITTLKYIGFQNELFEFYKKSAEELMKELDKTKIDGNSYSNQTYETIFVNYLNNLSKNESENK